MDIGYRVTKVEVEVETCKDGIARIEHAIDALQLSQLELRNAMERGFAEQRASMERAFAEQRKEANNRYYWLLGLIFTNMTFTFGVIIHIARAS